jgi:peptidoglycan/LPS O-acetylase OafA/YrhL
MQASPSGSNQAAPAKVGLIQDVHFGCAFRINGPMWSVATVLWMDCPWLLGSFAIGMLGAVIGFSPAWRDSPWRIVCRWNWLASAASAIIIAMVAAGRAEVWLAQLVDLLVSLWAICTINTCWSASAGAEPAHPDRLAGLLGSPRSVQPAGFSYSLYLVQLPGGPA